MSAVRLKSGPRQRGVLLGKRRERSVTEEISLDEKSVLSFRVSHGGRLARGGAILFADESWLLCNYDNTNRIDIENKYIIITKFNNFTTLNDSIGLH